MRRSAAFGASAMSQIDAIRRLLAKHDLSTVADRIVQSTKPSFQLRASNTNGAAPARSRLGGVPDLPNEGAWPVLGREALTFIGQIALDELPRDAAVNPLPNAGLLSFFYEAEGQPWGRATSERSSWRVLYTDDTQRLTRIQKPPRPVPVALRSLEIAFVPAITVPSMRSIELDRLELSRAQLDRYLNFQAAFTEAAWGGACEHQLLGHPDGIQGCMQRTAQFVSRDEPLPPGVHSYYKHPRAAELIPGAFDWQLLLQVDSDIRVGSEGNLGVMWGDAGRIYFWMHRDDLAARRFDQSWLFLQCG
jgi:uncharacterized protein YwqG